MEADKLQAMADATVIEKRLITAKEALRVEQQAIAAKSTRELAEFKGRASQPFAVSQALSRLKISGAAPMAGMSITAEQSQGDRNLRTDSTVSNFNLCTESIADSVHNQDASTECRRRSHDRVVPEDGSDVGKRDQHKQEY